MQRENRIIAASFCLGAISASVLTVWVLERRRKRRRRRRTRRYEEEEENSIDSDQDENWMEQAFKLRMEDLSSRIGELPERTRRRLRWLWEQAHTSGSSRVLEGEEDEAKPSPGAAGGVSRSSQGLSSPIPVLDDKTGLCIGSIFGLDVGGTLAKLVYFEQRDTFDVKHDELYPPPDPLSIPNAGPAPRRRTSTEDIWTQMPWRLDEIEENSFVRQYKARQESLPDNLEDFGSKQPTIKVNSTASTKHVLLNGSNATSSSHENDSNMKASNLPSTITPTKPPIERSRSIIDISKSRDHAEALGQFYTFVKQDHFGQSGVKDQNLTFHSRELGGDLHFIRFETRYMESAMDLIRQNKVHLNIREMGATGGGAHKYASAWEEHLGIQMVKQDELDSLVAGMQFVLSTVVGECYTFRPRIKSGKRNDSNNCDEEDESDRDAAEAEVGDDWWWSRKVQRDVVSPMSTYPCLLVTIGTGVSILRVDGPRDHVRVSGSTIGGGTYWGLIRLLTDVDNFEDVIKLAERGDPSKVDMMVGDIYGKNSNALEKIGLPSNLVASSFGKLVAKTDPSKGLKQEDIARALLLMVTNNIGQVAYLNAKLHKTPRIYFVGNFLRGNRISQRRLAYAIDYWSKGEMEALFLEHEGYFGALGAFLLSQGIKQTDDGGVHRDPIPPKGDSDLGALNLSEHSSRGLERLGLHRRRQTS